MNYKDKRIDISENEKHQMFQNFNQKRRAIGKMRPGEGGGGWVKLNRKTLVAIF